MYTEKLNELRKEIEMFIITKQETFDFDEADAVYIDVYNTSYGEYRAVKLVELKEQGILITTDGEYIVSDLSIESLAYLADLFLYLNHFTIYTPY